MREYRLAAIPPAAAASARAQPGALQVAKDVLLLAKPRLSGLVVLTTAGGLALAPGRIGALRATIAILGTAAVERLPDVAVAVGPTTFLRLRRALSGEPGALPDDPAAFARATASAR